MALDANGTNSLGEPAKGTQAASDETPDDTSRGTAASDNEAHAFCAQLIATQEQVRLASLATLSARLSLEGAYYIQSRILPAARDHLFRRDLCVPAGVALPMASACVHGWYRQRGGGTMEQPLNVLACGRRGFHGMFGMHPPPRT